MEKSNCKLYLKMHYKNQEHGYNFNEKINSNLVIFLWILRHFKNTYFEENLRTASPTPWYTQVFKLDFLKFLERED